MLVIKLNSRGKEVVRYEAELLSRRDDGTIFVRAKWQTPTVETATATFAHGDVLYEFFYSNRWYNVFALYAGESDELKGWYCNITRPTEVTPTEIRWTDLELDVWVSAEGKATVLDEDEFLAAQMSANERTNALDALETLKQLAADGELPTK